MPRVKTCKNQDCNKPITQMWSTLQRTCSPKCAIEYTRQQEKKKHRKAKREWKQANKTKPQLTKDAQDNAFNPFIRKRDHDKPCISCGRNDHEIPDIYTGGKWDCGHFLSVGSHPELRFHPYNAHRQCKSCNGGSGKYARKNHTVSTEYKERLIKRIGADMVEWLEGPQETQNWTHEDLRDIKQYYREKIRELEHGGM